MSDSPVQIEQLPEATVISFAANARSIHEEVIRQVTDPLLDLAQQAPTRVLVDLSGVEFFGSAFIELLFRIWNRVKTNPEGQFALCSLHPYCLEVLDVTNLTKVWKVYASREEALAALGSGTATWSPT